MVPNEAGWSLIPVTPDPNTNNFEFTIGGSIFGFLETFLMMVQPEFLLEEVSLTTSMQYDMLNNIGVNYRLCLIILELLSRYWYYGKSFKNFYRHFRKYNTNPFNT